MGCLYNKKGVENKLFSTITLEITKQALTLLIFHYFRKRKIQKVISENETYQKINFTNKQLASEYDGCTFVACNFENLKLGSITFLECEFINCNLSNVQLNYTAFKDVVFENCKLLGINFNDCNPFLLQLKFTNSDLTLSSFYQLVIKNTCFTSCNLSEVDFTEANLSNAIFDNCKLTSAIFENTTLEKTDFETATNFNIDPEKNRIKKAKFSQNNLGNLLTKYDINIK